MLGAVDDRIDQDLLRAAAPGWVPETRYLAECDSTNRVARQWAGEGAPHGSLVLTDYQSAGRGRLDRTWEAPAGTSLLFSVILRPSFPPEHWGLVALAAGLAVGEQLRDAGLDAYLKWPNDVLIDERKVAGILAEVDQEVIVLGAGINVNTPSFPPELAGVATSMRMACGRRFDRLQVLGGVVRCLSRIYDRLPAGLLDRYRAMCRTLGSRVRVDRFTESVEDVARDIDRSGSLVLAGGQVIPAGDVVHLHS